MKWWKTSATVAGAIEDGPVFGYTPPSGEGTRRMRVQKLAVFWEKGALVKVRLVGTALRQDGSEINWQSWAYNMTNPVERPDWLVELMEAEGWEWT